MFWLSAQPSEVLRAASRDGSRSDAESNRIGGELLDVLTRFASLNSRANLDPSPPALSPSEREREKRRQLSGEP